MSAIHRDHYLGYAIMGMGFASVLADLPLADLFAGMGVFMLSVYIGCMVVEYATGDSDE